MENKEVNFNEEGFEKQTNVTEEEKKNFLEGKINYKCKHCGLEFNIKENFEKHENNCLEDQEAREETRKLLQEDLPTEYFIIINYNKKGEETSRTVDIDKVAEYIENKFNIRTIFGIKEETIEVYNEGIWTTKGRGIIKAEIERLLGVYSKNNVVNEILEKIKRRTEIEREEAEIVPDYKRCLKNGVLDLEDCEEIKLIGHSKKFNFRSKFDINYDPESKCEFTLNFIREAFYEEDIPKFQEWLGLHLIRKYFEKKFAIFYGPKDTSKSVILNLLTIFLNYNVSGLSLQEISKAKAFDLLDLKDRDANICDDLSSRDMAQTGGIKMSVGDGFISGEQKFGDKIKFRNTAKQNFACNKMPTPGEDIDDEAYYGRPLLFKLDNVIPKERQDKKLIDKLTTPEELSGLLNWALEGYIRLRKNNTFTNDLSPEENKSIMMTNGNSLSEFATEILKEKSGAKISKESMYRAYCEWCANHKPKLSPDSKEKIGRNLNRFAPYAQASSNGSERYWLNVQFNDTYYTLQKNMSTFSDSIKEVKNDTQNNIYNFSESVISVSKKGLNFLDLIKENSDRMVSFDEIKSFFPDITKSEIEEAKAKGLIFSPKSNYLRWMG